MSETTTGLRAHWEAGRVRYARSRYHYLILSGALLVIFVLYTLLAVTWGPSLELDHALNRNFHVQRLWPELHFFDRVGQRVLCLRPLAVIIVFLAWRRRSLRPVLVAVAGVFLLNLLVLIVKLALSRGAPLSGESWFGDGDLYPSGHLSNVVVVYGLCYYVITRYSSVPEWVRRALLALVCLLGAIQFTTSILLRWHWFSDLIGGLLIGGVVLALIVGIDAVVPRRSRRAPVAERRTLRERQPALERMPERRELVDISPRHKRDDSRAADGDRPSRR